MAYHIIELRWNEDAEYPYTALLDALRELPWEIVELEPRLDKRDVAGIFALIAYELRKECGCQVDDHDTY